MFTEAPPFSNRRNTQIFGNPEIIVVFCSIMFTGDIKMAKKSGPANETVSFAVRLSKDQIRWIHEQAKQDNRTGGGVVRKLIDDARRGK